MTATDLKYTYLCLLIFLPQVLFAENAAFTPILNCSELTNSEAASENKTDFTPEEHEAINVLKHGGGITNLCVDAETISYVRCVRVTAGRTPQFDQRVNTCVETYFSILRVGLNVRSYGREPLLTGTPVVRIEGDISRDLKSNFDEYPISVRRDLERNFYRRERGNRTNFPVLGNFSQSKISNALRVLSNNYTK